MIRAGAKGTSIACAVSSVIVGVGLVVSCGGSTTKPLRKSRVVSSTPVVGSTTTSAQVASTPDGAVISVRTHQVCIVVRETPFISGGWIRRTIRKRCNSQPLANAPMLFRVGDKLVIPVGNTDAAGKVTIRWAALRPKLADSQARFGKVVVARTSEQVATLGIAKPAKPLPTPRKAVTDAKRKLETKLSAAKSAAATSRRRTQSAELAISMATKLTHGFAAALINAHAELSLVALGGGATKVDADAAAKLLTRIATATRAALRRAAIVGRRLRRKRKTRQAFVLLSQASFLDPKHRRVRRELGKVTGHLRGAVVGFVNLDFANARNIAQPGVTVALHVHRRARAKRGRLTVRCQHGQTPIHAEQDLPIKRGLSTLNWSPSLTGLDQLPHQCSLKVVLVGPSNKQRLLRDYCWKRSGALILGECP